MGTSSQDNTRAHLSVSIDQYRAEPNPSLSDVTEKVITKGGF